MLHVILLSDVYYPFMCGVTRVVDIFREELPKYNVKVSLFVPAPINEAYKIEERGNIDIILIKSWRLLGLYSEIKAPEIVSAYYSIRRYLENSLSDEDYIVIHSHSPYVIMSLLRLFGWRRGIRFPIIFTYHTLTKDYLEKRFGKLSRGFVMLDSVFLTNVIKRASVVITPTDYAKDILLDSIPRAFKILKRKFVKIPNPIDRDKFTTPQKRASDFFDFLEDYNYAIWVGRISHEKNIPFLMKIFSKLPYQLVIVGKGPLLSYLRKVAPKNVHLVGFVEEEVLKALLHFARCFVISNTFETLSLATIEAMAQGVPIVSYYKGGYTEFLKHGKNGFIFRTLNEAREYIRKLFTNDALREEMGKHARETAMRFHPDVIIPKYLRLYKFLAKPLRELKAS